MSNCFPQLYICANSSQTLWCYDLLSKKEDLIAAMKVEAAKRHGNKILDLHSWAINAMVFGCPCRRDICLIVQY